MPKTCVMQSCTCSTTKQYNKLYVHSYLLYLMSVYCKASYLSGKTTAMPITALFTALLPLLQLLLLTLVGSMMLLTAVVLRCKHKYRYCPPAPVFKSAFLPLTVCTICLCAYHSNNTRILQNVCQHTAISMHRLLMYTVVLSCKLYTY
jgi:hypothetical protein